MDGILLINKERGITSYDVIRRLKRILPKKQKIGHAGTLDPFATGLLIILLGKGTKLMNQILEMKKGYEVTAQFGFETDTQDITGEIIYGRKFNKEISLGKNESKKSPISVSEIELTKEIEYSKIEECLKKFVGEQEQIPPNYSAIKVNGKRAYDLARSGEQFEIKPRKINVYKISSSEKLYNWPELIINMEVSSGTYVRTLVVDIAHSLNTFATARELVRTFVGPFNLEDAVSSSKLAWTNSISEIQTSEQIDQAESSQMTFEELSKLILPLESIKNYEQN